MTCAEPADPFILHRSHLRGAAFISSFAEEAAAMQLALEWTTTNHPDHSLTICTGSQSLLKAIEQHPQCLAGPSCGYQGIPGNELADTEAKTAATTTSDPPRPTSYDSARSLIRRTLTDPLLASSRTAEVYGGFSWSKDCKVISNCAVLLARLRASHTPRLKAYANFFGPSTDPLCPLCKEEWLIIKHWLRRCPMHDAMR